MQIRARVRRSMDAPLDATKSAWVIVSLEEELEHWMQHSSGLNLIAMLRDDKRLKRLT